MMQILFKHYYYSWKYQTLSFDLIWGKSHREMEYPVKSNNFSNNNNYLTLHNGNVK